MPSNLLPKIIFVRHGETEWNKKGLIQGSIDTELDPLGIEQVKGLAKALAEMRDELIGFQFVVSPQRRAQQTMGIIAEALGLNMASTKTESRLRELGFGIWESTPYWELKASPIYPADPEGRYYWRPEGGESYEDGVARVDDWLTSVTGPTLVVAHGAVGRCLMGYVAGSRPSEIVALPTPQGCYCVLQDGKIQWFDAHHNAL